MSTVVPLIGQPYLQSTPVSSSSYRPASPIPPPPAKYHIKACRGLQVCSPPQSRGTALTSADDRISSHKRHDAPNRGRSDTLVAFTVHHQQEPQTFLPDCNEQRVGYVDMDPTGIVRMTRRLQMPFHRLNHHAAFRFYTLTAATVLTDICRTI